MTDVTPHHLDDLGQLLISLTRLTGCEAAIYDRDGRCLAHYSPIEEPSNKPLLEALPEDLDWPALQAPQCLTSARVPGAELGLIPLADNLILILSNEKTISGNLHLLDSLHEALPAIAKVVGGEGVIFDDEGRRLVTISPTGEVIPNAHQGFSRYAMEAMKAFSVVIGPSTSIAGAMAVRVPLNRKFGLGFNNELSVSQKEELQEKLNRDKTARYTFQDIIGESQAIKGARQLAQKVAPGHSTILIHGETGTGKEFFAQAIHNASGRRCQPFVAINCGAIPSSLIESILFGYESGAFTGASREGRPGLFEQAQGGTLFLDEVSEMEYDLQAKLLRVLQEQEIVRIGGKRHIKVDVRVISSTNKNLEHLITDGKFREDLLFRLDVVRIDVPPLRERAGDVPLLAKYFIQKLNRTLGTQVTTIDTAAAMTMADYQWPGNVRELHNCIERALNTASHGVITQADLPYRIRQSVPAMEEAEDNEEEYDLKFVLDRAERSHILGTLRRAGGDKDRAADILGVSPVTLWRKMKKYRLN